jgi:hypothetical protein
MTFAWPATLAATISGWKPITGPPHSAVVELSAETGSSSVTNTVAGPMEAGSSCDSGWQVTASPQENVQRQRGVVAQQGGRALRAHGVDDDARLSLALAELVDRLLHGPDIRRRQPGALAGIVGHGRRAAQVGVEAHRQPDGMPRVVEQPRPDLLGLRDRVQLPAAAGNAVGTRGEIHAPADPLQPAAALRDLKPNHRPGAVVHADLQRPGQRYQRRGLRRIGHGLLAIPAD